MRASVILALLLTAGCGETDFPGSPTREVPSFYTQPPSPPVFVDRTGPPSPPSLPATVPALGGAWRGTFAFLDAGNYVQLQIAGALTQQARAVTLTFQSAGGSISGSVAGTLEGLGADTRLVGTLTFTAGSSVPGVRCTVTSAVSGPAWPALAWWDGPHAAIANCTGDLSDLRLRLYH